MCVRERECIVVLLLLCGKLVWNIGGHCGHLLWGLTHHYTFLVATHKTFYVIKNGNVFLEHSIGDLFLKTMLFW